MKILGSILFLFLFAAPAFAQEYAELATTNFQFEYTEPDEKMAKYLASNSEKIRREVAYLVGFDFKAATTVRIAPDHETYVRAHQGKILPEWSAGAAFPKENLIILLSLRGSKERIDPLPVFKHELCHIVLGRALAGRVIPRWLDEGIAKFESEPWSRSKSFRMSLAMFSGSYIPLSQLVDRWPADERDARIAYLESQAFADYLFRQAAVSSVVDSLREGDDIPTALTRATGWPMPGLEKEFEHFLKRNFTWANFFIEHDFFWGLAGILFLIAVAISWIRSRKKLRRMELEDELEDMENDLDRLARENPRNLTRQMIEHRRAKGPRDDYDA